MIRYILASGSPRRKELLERMGLNFEVRISHTDEAMNPCLTSEELACELATQKAMDVACEIITHFSDKEAYETWTPISEAEEELTATYVVIGADTIVVKDGKILGKPMDQEDAKRMLQSLQGSVHEVITGVALWQWNGHRESRKTFYEKTRVSISPMTDLEIANYVATGEPMDKAGAYGIQGRFAPYVERIEGDYYNVVGLPLCSLRRELYSE